MSWHFGGGFAPYDDEPSDTHTHEWTLYEGLLERYYFCKTCDKKKGIKDD